MVENLIYIVYCTVNIVNKKIYIGVHKTNKNEKSYYLGCGVYANLRSSYEHPKTAFQYAVKEFGPKNFKRFTIKEFNNEEDAYLFESELVNEEFLKRSDVYNMVLGGKSGISNLNSIPCYQYDLKGNYLSEYSSQQEASLAINRGFTPLRYAIKNKTQCGGYLWSIDKVEKLNLNEFNLTSNKVLVYQYSNTGEYDCCYESVSDAARVNNTSTSNINRSCKLGYLTNNKYFSYIFSKMFCKAKQESLRNRKIYQYSLSGEFLNEYNSLTDAERYNNLKRGLSNAVKMKRTYGGYQWSLEKLDKMDSIEIKHSPKKVGQYDLNNNLIKVYNTVTECTKDFSGCRHVLHGNRKTSGGFIFKYID